MQPPRSGQYDGTTSALEVGTAVTVRRCVYGVCFSSKHGSEKGEHHGRYRNLTWERDERTFVYLSKRRARYASVANTRDGRLITLFTRRSAQQEAQGTGDLVLMQAIRDGRWWSKDTVVYEGTEGEPRAYGTLTVLDSGRILAPFVEVGAQSKSSRLRMLTSDDDGRTFRSSKPVSMAPLRWAAPPGGLGLSSPKIPQESSATSSRQCLRFRTGRACACSPLEG